MDFLISSFNSRPHKEVDDFMRFTPFSICNFQFTTSQGGRPQCKEIIYGRGFFQFTTSQGGRQTLWMTHTADLLFQFTTSQGGRQYLGLSRTESSSFNSRPHKEVDDIAFQHLFKVKILSIHDLTRRSTFRDNSRGR